MIWSSMNLPLVHLLSPEFCEIELVLVRHKSPKLNQDIVAQEKEAVKVLRIQFDRARDDFMITET